MCAVFVKKMIRKPLQPLATRAPCIFENHSMNKIHRTVWSEARQCFVVASEAAKAKGKASSTRSSATVVAALLALGGMPLSAGATVIADTDCIVSQTTPLTGVNVVNSNVDIGIVSCTFGDGASLNVQSPNGYFHALNEVVRTTVGGALSDISNAGTISSGASAIFLNDLSSVARISNAVGGLIQGGGAGNGVQISGSSGARVGVTGLTNAGSITGSGWGVITQYADYQTGVANSGKISGDSGLRLERTALTGDLSNSGTIVGNAGSGLTMRWDGSMQKLLNEGTISGGGTYGAGLNIWTRNTIASGITNTGLIQSNIASHYPSALNVANSNVGTVRNGGTIASSQDAAASGYAIKFTSNAIAGALINSGTITGMGAVLIDSSSEISSVQNGDTGLIDGQWNVTSPTSLVTNAGTLALPANTVSTIAGDFVQGVGTAAGTLRTRVNASSQFGALAVGGAATMAAATAFDVVFANTTTCGGLTAGGTLAGVVTSTGTLSLTGGSTFSGAVTHNCGAAITISAVKRGNAVNLETVGAPVTSWTVTGATNGNGSVDCSFTSPITNNGTASCTASASGGYQLSSAAGSGTLCGTVSASGNTITAGPVTGACTVTGTFAAIPPSTYAITTTASPTAGGTVACSPNPVTSGGSSTCTPTAATGYTFSAFSGDCSGATCTLTNVTSAKSVTGTFVQNTYAITATASPTAGGSVACSPNPVTSGGSSTCTPTAATGYTFSTFSGDCSGATCTLTNVTSAKSVTGTFVQNTYAITTTASPTAGGTVACSPNPVTSGGSSTCTPTAATGYTFSAFSGDCSGATCTLTNVTSAKSVTGTFVQNTYAITATASPTAGGSVACSPNPVTSGGSSTCTPTAATGYTFSTFSGDCSGATCTLTNVTSAKSVTGTFVQNTYAITTTASPTAGGTVACSPNPVTSGGSSTCTPTAATGYTFSTFSGDCSGSTCNLTNVTSVKSVTATFTANTANGACGSAAGVASAVVPNANLCAPGSTPSLVSAGSGGFSWSCEGTGVGSVPAQCTAPGATAPGGGTVTFEPISGGCSIRSLTLGPPPTGGPGNGVVMPFGVVNFTLESCTENVARVRTTYSSSVAGMQFWKYINAGWTQVNDPTANLVISGNTVTFDIVDNGPYDGDSTLHVIADPGGPGYAPVVAATPQSIPTLSEWGMIFLSSLVAMFGLTQVRRRRG